jgi:starch-binding outer membrane protein, SusD/RagB family
MPTTVTRHGAPHRSITAAALLTLAGCGLDVSNPNAATEEDVLATAAGLRALAIGMQGRLGNALEEGIYIPALVSGELGNTNATQSTTREFQRFPTPSANSQIEETNVDVLDLWVKHYAVVKSANDILDNHPRVTLAPGTRAGMLALAKLHKAIALATLIEAFEQIPIADLGGSTPAFADRATVLAEALTLLATAKSDATGTPLSAEFTGSILDPGLDLLNAIRAMQARYALAAGQYEDALTFADEVPPTATSVVTYTTLDRNPFRDLFHGARFFGALASFRANAESGDTRVDAFTTSSVDTGFGGATLNEMNVYRSDDDPIPLFTQGELTLIRAEAHARAGRLPEAIAQINVVRTSAGLPMKTAADLPTQQAVLGETFTQRTYSLFVRGLHWADLRRFGLIAQAKVAYLPYPLAERATNPNTPPNPQQTP